MRLLLRRWCSLSICWHDSGKIIILSDHHLFFSSSSSFISGRRIVHNWSFHLLFETVWRKQFTVDWNKENLCLFDNFYNRDRSELHCQVSIKGPNLTFNILSLENFSASNIWFVCYLFKLSTIVLKVLLDFFESDIWLFCNWFILCLPLFESCSACTFCTSAFNIPTSKTNKPQWISIICF